MVGILESQDLTAGVVPQFNRLRLNNGSIVAHNNMNGIADQFATIGNFGAPGNVIGILIDADADTISFTVNGTLLTTSTGQGTNSVFSLNGVTNNSSPNSVYITVYQDAVINVNMTPLVLQNLLVMEHSQVVVVALSALLMFMVMLTSLVS